MATWHVGTENRHGAAAGASRIDDEPSGEQHAVLDRDPSVTACGLPVGLFVEFRAIAFDVAGSQRCERCCTAMLQGTQQS